MTEMNILTIGAVVKEGMVPVVEVLINDEVAGYLCPFRQYSFQICADDAGNWDLGSSHVVGLKHYRVNSVEYPSNVSAEGITKEALAGIAMLAIVKFANRKKAIIDIEYHNEYLTKHNTFDDFIDKCYKGLFTN